MTKIMISSKNLKQFDSTLHVCYNMSHYGGNMYKVEIKDTEGRLKNTVLLRLPINLYETRIKKNAFRKKFTFARKINIVDKPRTISIKYKPRYKKRKNIKNNMDILKEYINIYKEPLQKDVSLISRKKDKHIELSNQIVYGK